MGLSIMWMRYGAAVATTLLTFVSGAAALIDIFATWRLRAGQREASTEEQLTEATQVLAREVRTQWEAEASRRLLQDVGELTVRWRASVDSGDLRTIVTSYAEQQRRLVVVGEPGSGKTGLCLLLVLEILRQPTPPRVPVILQISSWDPADNLHAWLIRSIAEQYPFLGNEARYGPTAIRDLVKRHRILPVLDALDEMVERRRAEALTAVTRDARPDEPLVLTCRTAEFTAANSAGIVRNAQVVRLLPVEAETAAGYLLDAASDLMIDKWDPLLTELTANDDGPVAEALRTPLMLFLARTAFANPDTDPSELLELPEARHIEERLLDMFPRQVFANRPPSPLSDAPRLDRQWDPADAERWLAFLAKHNDREIAWWRLRKLVPLWVLMTRAVVVGAVTCTPLGWLLFALFGRPWLGVVVGCVVGVVSSVVLCLMPSDPPRRFVPRLLRRRELGREIGSGLIGAVVGGVAVGMLYGAGYGIAIGLVFGVAFGLVRRFTEPTEPGEAVTPMSMLRGDRLAVFYAAGFGGVVGALVGAVMGGLVGATTRGLVIDVDNPFMLGFLGAVVGAAIGAGGLGMVAQATSAWGRFITTRLWLAQQGATPLRLMDFLEDAHRLGVLRQLGPFYQFRHALLQDRLALRS
jgi:hypothetical protein